MRFSRLSHRTLTVALVALVFLSSLAASTLTQVQAANTVITVAVQDNLRELYTNTVIPEFMKANPGITVQAVSATLPNVGNAANDAAAYLDAIQNYVSQADVVMVRASDVSPEGTRNGYYLNLQPLVSSDNSLNQPDFFPNVFRAFQWDQGMWALPLSVDVTILTYDPAAFDAANVTYPTAQWTLNDLISAVTKLTVKDSAGKVTTPGIELFRGNNDISLYMSLLGKPLTDPNALPNPPLLVQPDVQALLDALPNLFAIVPAQSNTFGAAPIQIGSIRNLSFQNPNSTTVRKGALLPGGHAYLDVSGVAVSSSTQYPEAAYTFAKFLTTRADITTRGRTYPARASLVGQNAGAGQGGAAPGGGGPGGFGGTGTLTPEVQALYTNALANGYSNTDRRYFNYLNRAINQMQTAAKDSGSALAEAQTLALKNQQIALDRKADSSKVAVVATPIPALAANAGIVLKFGMAATGQQGSIPNKAAIQALADQFVKDNPGVVARVDIFPINQGPNGVNTAAASYDAFYVPYSVVPNLALDSILALSPFLDADSSYSAADFVGGTLAQVTRDNKIWALPLGIQPTVMWYDPLSFSNNGLTKPAAGWDVSAFADDIKTLKPTVKNGNPPFAAQSDLGSSMLMLMASYGGLPIDYRTTPVTVNFTAQANIDAMRQVLDLAKNGLITYEPLGTNFGFFARGGDEENPIYSQLLNGFNFRPQNPNRAATATATNFTPVTYPKGSKSQLVAYSLGTLYVSAAAQNADASYKWIKVLSGHPELLRLMPARQSILSSPALETAYGVPLAQTYRDIGKILDDSSTVTAPSIVGGFNNLQSQAVQHWLYVAWDDYVAKGTPLETSLPQAQQYATGFLQCTASVPPFDAKQQVYNDYLNAILKCATQVDPTLVTR